MNKNPYLQYRHSEGLGDFIACTLHSKFILPVTKLITGSEEICFSCDKRRQALNYIFPIPFWKVFFENYDKKLQDLQKYFNLKEEEEEPKNDIVIQSHEEIKEIVMEEVNVSIPEYKILSESSTEIDDYIFKIIIYKKK
jgi:hypothetical protein